MPRITAGVAKNTSLEVAKDITRPITDRIKISLFDQLSPVIDSAKCLDLFAGSGSLGLEAISRGASRVVFVEQDSDACEIIIRNSKKAKLDQQIEIVNLPVEDYLRFPTTVKHDLIFIDPPFPMIKEDKEDILRNTSRFTVKGGYIVFRYPKLESFPETLKTPFGLLFKVLEKKYGISKVSFYQNQ